MTNRRRVVNEMHRAVRSNAKHLGFKIIVPWHLSEFVQPQSIWQLRMPLQPILTVRPSPLPKL
jgi:hypothetical protein